MLIKSKAIVLSKIKYGDNDLIVGCYTRHRGFVSYMVKHALKPSKSKPSKSAYFQPLSQLTIEENFNSRRDLQFFKSLKLHCVFKSLHTNIFKSAIVLFLAEVLTSVLKEEAENKELYIFLETAFQYFDEESNFSNFHLLFLVKLTRYLGFNPDKRYIEAPYFNLKSGHFQSKAEAPYTITGKNLTLLKIMLGTDFDALDTIKLSAERRNSFLNMLLFYFQLHLESFSNPKSLNVLTDVFR